MKKLTLIACLLANGIAPSVQAAPPPGACATASPSLKLATTNTEIFQSNLCDDYALAVMAYVWGKPFVDAAKIRVFFTQPNDPLASRPSSVAGAALNRFGHGRILADPLNKSGVGPNNDTLYSNATFDLASGPFVVTTPDFGDRYYTFSVAHPDSSTSASLGSRTHGGKLPPLFLHASTYKGAVPPGMIEITSGDRYLHLWGRTLVRSPEDIPAVRALQDAMKVERFVDGKIEPVGPPPEQRAFPQGDSPQAFLQQLAAALLDMDLSPQDAKMAARLAPLLRRASQQAQVSKDVQRGIADATEIVARAASGFGQRSGGWSTNLAGARFGSDWLLRAAVAKDQIFVTLPEEAIYPIARTSTAGTPLDGKSAYRLHFASPPPVRAFWSITLYDNNGAMTANPIDRYSIGDRTSGLKKDDGTLRDIVISHSRPKNMGAVWLPAPEGPFYLMMRLYGPGEAVQTGRWLPPAIQPSTPN